MSEQLSPTLDGDSRVAEAKRTVVTIQAALAEGKAPRGRRPLGDAARLLKGLELYADAAQALMVLARLEARREDTAAALSSIRSALRLADRGSAAGFDAVGALLLAARICALVGDDDRALSHATQAHHRGREDSRSLACLAAVHFLAGRVSQGLAMAEAAEEKAEAPASHSARVLPGLLVLAKCPTVADQLLTAKLRQVDSQPEAIPALLLLRGWARLSLGDTGPSARDFRKARTLTHTYTDRRPEARALAGLAAAEATRALAEGDPARLARAQTQATRATRLAERARDSQLQDLAQSVHASTNGGETPLLARATENARRAWAGELTTLAKDTESLGTVLACRREVERLALLPESATMPPPSSMLYLALRTELFDS